MCNNCQNTTCYECNQQPPCAQNDCSCPVKDLSTDCILYTGADLPCSGIKTKTILTDLIQQLDEFICTLSQQSSLFSLINIGTGSQIYRGTTLTGAKELRTIKEVGDFITIALSQTGEEIEIKESPIEALKKLEMSFDWKNSNDFSLIKLPTDMPNKVTDSKYKRNGFIGYIKPLQFPVNQVQHPDYYDGVSMVSPILVEADIYNLGIKIKDFNKIKDYSPVVVISKYLPTRKHSVNSPAPIPGTSNPIEYFPNDTYKKASFKFSNDNDTVRLTRVPIQAQYQVIDFGQEHYFKTSKEFQKIKSLGGGKIEHIFETRGAKKRYSQCKLTYPISEAGDTGKLETTTSRAFVYLQFHIEIVVDGIKHISPVLGKLKMIASIDTPAQDTLVFSNGDIVSYDYLLPEYGFFQRTKITFKHT